MAISARSSAGRPPTTRANAGDDDCRLVDKRLVGSESDAGGGAMRGTANMSRRTAAPSTASPMRTLRTTSGVDDLRGGALALLGRLLGAGAACFIRLLYAGCHGPENRARLGFRSTSSSLLRRAHHDEVGPVALGEPAFRDHRVTHRAVGRVAVIRVRAVRVHAVDGHRARRAGACRSADRGRRTPAPRGRTSGSSPSCRRTRPRRGRSSGRRPCPAECRCGTRRLCPSTAFINACERLAGARPALDRRAGVEQRDLGGTPRDEVVVERRVVILDDRRPAPATPVDASATRTAPGASRRPAPQIAVLQVEPPETASHSPSGCRAPAPAVRSGATAEHQRHHAADERRREARAAPRTTCRPPPEPSCRYCRAPGSCRRCR